MKPLAVTVILCAIPPAALAADWTVFLYFGALQTVSRLWPFILPLFYLKGARFKGRLYLVLLLLPLGVLELVDAPWSMVTDISVWGVHEYPREWLSTYAVGRHVVAFCVSIWLMPRLRRLVTQGLDSDRLAQPGATAGRTVPPAGG